jgi:pSer/pThr/pTyr-binding forkhead associated (FHA) protein
MSARPDELFAAACGLTGPWKITVYRPGHPAREHIFEQPFVLVGEWENSGLRLEDSRVSGCHLYLQVLPQGVYCVDLDSRTGTLVDGELRDHWWLRPGDTVGVGPFVLEVDSARPSNGVPAWNPMSRPAENDPPLPLVAAGVYGAGGLAVGRWRMNAVVALLGNSPRCKARMHHDSVSWFHCGLVRTRLGLWVIDLLSNNGTVVNGRRVECGAVQDRDHLQIGEFGVRMRLHFPPESQSAVPVAQHSNGPPYPLVPNVPAPGVESGSFAVTAPVPARTAGVSVVAQGGVPEVTLPVSIIHQFARIQQDLFEQFHRDLDAMAGLFLTMHREQMDAIKREMTELRRLTEEIQTLQGELQSQQAPPRLTGPAVPAPEAVGPPSEPKKAGEPAPAAPPRVPPEKKAPMPAPSTSGQPREDIHAWLNQRIAALTNEHRSRWKKLLGMILGR